MIDVHHLDRAVGSVLRKARELVGLSLSDVARLTGDRFKPSTVAGYERGERSISVSRFLTLARFYGKRPGELLSEAVSGSERAGEEDVVVVLPHEDASGVASAVNSSDSRSQEMD